MSLCSFLVVFGMTFNTDLIFFTEIFNDISSVKFSYPHTFAGDRLLLCQSFTLTFPNLQLIYLSVMYLSPVSSTG